MTSSFPTSVALFALLALNVGALDTCLAAVYEHAIILPKNTETPISQQGALLLMNKNIDILEKAIKQAAEKICTMLKCRTTALETGGDSVEAASTSFEMFSLSGTFGTQYVFPEVLLSDVQLAPGEFQVSSDGRLFSLKPTSGPVLTVTLFGRWYEKDQALNASSEFRARALRLMKIALMIIVLTIVTIWYFY
ncbi:pantetheinase-like [Elephas maximus indicus]|uniref:pantetheinase-like n=1 Tax=Elephas maximus indicus TaxID=99487 RepID=UPI002115FA44|nr:pantetheinase-like [Elephas maximus indicus]